MTFSILVCDPETGAFGGAAATGNLCVGAWVLPGRCTCLADGLAAGLDPNFSIQTYVRSLQYEKAVTVTIVVALIVLMIEAGNGWLRRMPPEKWCGCWSSRVSGSGMPMPSRCRSGHHDPRPASPRRVSLRTAAHLDIRP